MISFFSVLMWLQLVLSSLSLWEVSPESQQSLPIARTDTEVSASYLASVSPLDSREILEQYKSQRGWEQSTPPRASAGSRILGKFGFHGQGDQEPASKLGVRWWQKKNTKNNSHHLSSSFLKSQLVSVTLTWFSKSITTREVPTVIGACSPSAPKIPTAFGSQYCYHPIVQMKRQVQRG